MNSPKTVQMSNEKNLDLRDLAGKNYCNKEEALTTRSTSQSQAEKGFAFIELLEKKDRHWTVDQETPSLLPLLLLPLSSPSPPSPSPSPPLSADFPEGC